ncbi:MAG: sodium:proton exchanger [Actinomycetota bacterium]|nr:sodium:proton exchanger [Actinomycetota bacterium]
MTAVLVGIAGALDLAGSNAVVRFVAAAVALATLARLVGTATEQLGGRLGAGGAGTVQSALGNLPELFVALFALRKGLVSVVKAALIGSVLANSLLVLGLAFFAGGLRNGVQRFDSPRARTIATLTLLAAAILSIPTFASTLHAPAAAHEQTLSLICGGVLLIVFFSTLGIFLGAAGAELEQPRWPLWATIAVLAASATGAVFVSDWFVSALQPATASLHMSETFAGLVVVAIAGNAVENVVGVQFALRNRPDFAIAVIVNSSLQVALVLTPVVLFASLFFATSLTLVFPTLLAVSLLLAAFVTAVVVYDGESTWPEGVVLVGLYVVIAAAFWWG